jgi:hypothetical protein
MSERSQVERHDPTPEEEAQFDQTCKAWEMCKKHWDENGKPGGIQVAGACPRCGDKLKYAVSTYNGHFAVWCDATGCLSARE